MTQKADVSARLRAVGGDDVLARFRAAGWKRDELHRLFRGFDRMRGERDAMDTEQRPLAPLKDRLRHRLRHRTSFRTVTAAVCADLLTHGRREGRPEGWLEKIFRVAWATENRRRSESDRPRDDLGRICFAAIFGVNLSPRAYTEQRRRDEMS
jgi:hypothetical protein